jgi:predicted acyltransferase
MEVPDSRDFIRSERVESPQTARVMSVDIYRGLTMLVMILVNDLAGVKGLPWWNYHLPAQVDGMTYVDWVFPGFLFAIGMSLPLAVNRRIELGASTVSLWLHIFTRSLSLALLGLIIANASKLDPALAGVGAKTWFLAALLGSFLLWGSHPTSSKKPLLDKGCKFVGLLLIVAMLALFRRKAADGSAAWLDISYWEILGLIGWTYLGVCILYVPLIKKTWAPIALLSVFTVMNVLGKAGLLGPLRHLPIYLWPFGTGALASIVVAGVVASDIFLGRESNRTFREKALRGLAFTVILFVAGWLLTPYGISKIRATPTWCLYCSGISTLAFLALYWLLDVKRLVGWAGFVKPAGSNTLLTYLLPDVFYAAVGFNYASAYFSEGLPGAARSLVFTLFILGCAWILTRLKFRMQL